MDFARILPILLPIIALQVILIIVGLRDLMRPERTVRGDSKLLWGLIIVFLGLLGPILYLTIGRTNE